MFTTPNRCDCTSSAQNNELVHKSNRYNCAPCTKTDMFALTSPNRYACAHSTNPNCSHSAKPIWLSSQHPADLLALATPKRYHCAHSTEMICLCSQHQTDTIISFVDHVVATTGHACPRAAEIHIVSLSCFDFHSRKFVVILKRSSPCLNGSSGNFWKHLGCVCSHARINARDHDLTTLRCSYAHCHADFKCF